MIDYGCHLERHETKTCDSCGGPFDYWAAYYTTCQCPVCGEVYQEVYFECQACAAANPDESYLWLTDRKGDR